MKPSLVHRKELDGIRGAAALGVLTYHLMSTVTHPRPLSSLPTGWLIASRIADFGFYGIDVFFVLSGFLITSLALADRNKPYFLHNFYTKRFLRIEPVYLLHILVAWLTLSDSHYYLFSSLIFLSNFASYFNKDLGTSWTLAIEAQFYLVWPLILRRFTLKNIYRVCIGIMLLSAGLRMGMIVFAHHIQLGSTWYQLDGLAMGALLACQWMGEDESTPRPIGLFLQAFNSGIMLFGSAAWFAIWAAGYFMSADYNQGMLLFPLNYLVYRAIRFIMHHPNSRRFRLFASAPMTYLGLISYSMYMFHLIWIYIYDKQMGTPPLDPFRFFMRAIAVLIVTGLTCVLIREGVEKPIDRLRPRFLKRMPKAKAGI